MHMAEKGSERTRRFVSEKTVSGSLSFLVSVLLLLFRQLPLESPAQIGSRWLERGDKSSTCMSCRACQQNAFLKYSPAKGDNIFFRCENIFF